MRAYVRAMRACGRVALRVYIYICPLLADLIPQSRKIRRDSKKLEGGGQEWGSEEKNGRAVGHRETA